MALVSDEPRLASARALRDCALLRLSKTAYEALLTHEPDAVAPFAEAISERVARTARTRQAIAAIRSSSPVTLEECAVLASATDRAAVDAGIRQLCHPPRYRFLVWRYSALRTSTGSRLRADC